MELSRVVPELKGVVLGRGGAQDEGRLGEDPG